MLDTYQIRQDDLPEDMRLLLNQFPRDSWDAHPGFKDKTRQWMNAHHGFRRLAERVRADTEMLLDREMAADDYAARLSFLGGRLVGNLHGHHHWEDHSYFPELSAADPRFDAGLEVLEQDHANLDVVLDDFTRLRRSGEFLSATSKLPHLGFAAASLNGWFPRRTAAKKTMWWQRSFCCKRAQHENPIYKLGSSRPSEAAQHPGITRPEGPSRTAQSRHLATDRHTAIAARKAGVDERWLHFVQEDQSVAIGRALADWLRRN